jgi:hypothetical protein
MPEWLTEAFPAEAVMSPGLISARLLTSLVAGAVVAVIYAISRGRENSEARAMTTTLLLLTILVAIVSLVIGNSVARAFSLVGALSIVRFRTVVDDTRDTAFVIFAVIVGMAIGAGQFMIAAFGIPVVGVAAVGLHLRQVASEHAIQPAGILLVRLGLGRSPTELLKAVIDRHAVQSQITAVSTARQGAAIDVTYSLRLRSSDVLSQMVSDLNQIEGVVSVELRRV